MRRWRSDETRNSEMQRRLIISVFSAMSGLIVSTSGGLAQGATTTPSTPPSAPAPTTAAPAQTPVSPPPKESSAGAPSSELQFETAAQARSHCPTDTVVWANLEAKVYHFYGTRRYGATKHGAYMCEHEALSAGIKTGKNEKHP